MFSTPDITTMILPSTAGLLIVALFINNIAGHSTDFYLVTELRIFQMNGPKG
jgi:hypothetical protein